MATQDTFLNALDRFGAVAREAEVDDGLIEQAEDHRAKVAGFRVLIPIVGSFNAGKTSLVNAWLERPAGAGLPTAIVPQTALATEVHVADGADAEAVELYGRDDRLLRRVDLAEFQRVEKQASTGESEAEYARAMLHAPRGDRPWDAWKVLVDMPGLDSGLRTHNAAIQRYLPLGSYFILVVDVEHGALRATELEQLAEFLDREVEFAVLVNKTDKKRDDAPGVVEHIAEQVRRRFGRPADVLPVSAHAGDVAAFRKVVDTVDFDRPLRNFWRARILTLFDDAIGSLHTRYGALNVSSAERERTVAALEEEKQALEAKLRGDEQEVRERYSDRAVDGIVRSARDAIRGHAAELAQTLQNGGRQAFEYELNELVRTTLNRVVDRERNAVLQQIIERYEAEFTGIDAHHERFLRAGEHRAGAVADAPAIPAELSGHVRGAAQASARAFDQAKGRIAGATTAYTAVTGVLAAATSIVAPWLEVVVILLPTIFNWLSRKAEDAQRQQRLAEQREQMQAQIASVVAPKVASELRERVAADFASATKAMIAGLGEQVRAAIDRIRADIDRGRAEIEEQKRDVEQRKEQLRAAIEQLTAAKSTVAEA